LTNSGNILIMTLFKRLIARKNVSDITKDAEESGYKRELGVWDLLSVGVGGIIGAGIFVLTGKAARLNAGPGIVLSYLIAGFVSTLASLCYAELASSLPVSGSAYSFSYATLGEFLAWIVGWDLMLEYLVGGATVAVGYR
jgi:APA family basic amino acid/polyamine antiporter